MTFDEVLKTAHDFSDLPMTLAEEFMVAVTQQIEANRRAIEELRREYDEHWHREEDGGRTFGPS